MKPTAIAFFLSLVVGRVHALDADAVRALQKGSNLDLCHLGGGDENDLVDASRGGFGGIETGWVEPESQIGEGDDAAESSGEGGHGERRRALRCRARGRGGTSGTDGRRPGRRD